MPDELLGREQPILAADRSTAKENGFKLGLLRRELLPCH